MTLRVALLIAVTSLGLAACHRIDNNKIDAPKLLVEAAKLIEKAKQEDLRRNRPGESSKVLGVYELPECLWPEAIAALKPSVVRYSYRGLWILDFKWVSKEHGIFISAEEWRTSIDLPELAPGIFEYHSE